MIQFRAIALFLQPRPKVDNAYFLPEVLPVIFDLWFPARSGSIFERSRDRTTIIKIAVILPVYNKANCIEQTCDRILECSQKNHAYNFIIVNDGSTDNTLEILENQLKTFPTHHIKLIYYSHRQGKGYAVKKGCEDEDADCICFRDCDLAYSIQRLEPLVEKLEKCDIFDCKLLTGFSFHAEVLFLAKKKDNFSAWYFGGLVEIAARNPNLWWSSRKLRI